jgi:DNA polymerase I-like protein with 3'-5' exonuclease and polymerase domains
MLTFITNRVHDVAGIRTIPNVDELCAWLDKLSEVSIDIETDSLDPLLAQIFLVSIGNEERQYVIDATSVSLDFINRYQHLLWVGHNIKYDYTVLKHNGIQLCYLYDTMIVEQRLGMGSGRKNALDVTILRRLGIKTKMNKHETRSSFT